MGWREECRGASGGMLIGVLASGVLSAIAFLGAELGPKLGSDQADIDFARRLFRLSSTGTLGFLAAAVALEGLAGKPEKRTE